MQPAMRNEKALASAPMMALAARVTRARTRLRPKPECARKSPGCSRKKLAGGRANCDAVRNSPRAPASTRLRRNAKSGVAMVALPRHRVATLEELRAIIREPDDQIERLEI